MPRWAKNVSILVGLEASYAACLTAVVRAPVSVGLTVLAFGMLFTLPLLPVYFVIVARLPSRWTDRRRRVVAILLSPLLLTFFALGVAAFTGATGLFLLAVAVPGAFAYGWLVRLPPSPTNPRFRATNEA